MRCHAKWWAKMAEDQRQESEHWLANAIEDEKRRYKNSAALCLSFAITAERKYRYYKAQSAISAERWSNLNP